MKSFVKWLSENSAYDFGDRLQPELMSKIGNLVDNAYCDVSTLDGQIIGFISLPREKYEFLSTRKGHQSLSNLKRWGQFHQNVFNIPGHVEVRISEKPKR